MIYVQLGKSASVTFEKLKQAYGEHSLLLRAQDFRWHKSFLERRERVVDKPRSRKPLNSKTDENVESVRALVRSDHRLTIRMMSVNQLNLNTFTLYIKF